MGGLVPVSSYDLYVSRNDGPFELMLEGTTETSHTFTGESGSTYAFISVAHDNVGHSERMPTVADAQTLVIIGAWVNRDDLFDVDASGEVSALDALVIINEMGRNSVSDPETFILTPLPPDGYAPPYYDVTEDGKVTALDALRVINQLARINLSGGVEREEALLFETLTAPVGASGRSISNDEMVDAVVGIERLAILPSETPLNRMSRAANHAEPGRWIVPSAVKSDRGDFEDAITMLADDVTKQWEAAGRLAQPKNR